MEQITTTSNLYVVTDEIVSKLNSLPVGTMGIATALLGRYREFDQCVNDVWIPTGSIKRYCKGVDVGFSFNDMTRHMLEDPTHQWLWILGDDHTFAPDLWMKLFDRNVDIVVPLCLHKATHQPVINFGASGGYSHVPNAWDVIAGKKGLFEWNGTCGNAGMLIRRRVFERLEPPWFRQGQLDPKFSSSDLFFSKYAQENGFKIYIDLDNVIGHIDHISLWPRKGEDGLWYIDYRPADVV